MPYIPSIQALQIRDADKRAEAEERAEEEAEQSEVEWREQFQEAVESLAKREGFPNLAVYVGDLCAEADHKRICDISVAILHRGPELISLMQEVAANSLLNSDWEQLETVAGRFNDPAQLDKLI